ncbi:hypothetical protein RIR_jg1771.t1 [Rhizophagus irregularis DAOM 181602=DAOM 197198]|nr:hypothetical protein RIR_jg1771.t1 [Rhizophagus irregularis DAOM 181602=DAOM 197198]
MREIGCMTINSYLVNIPQQTAFTKNIFADNGTCGFESGFPEVGNFSSTIQHVGMMMYREKLVKTFRLSRNLRNLSKLRKHPKLEVIEIMEQTFRVLAQ